MAALRNVHLQIPKNRITAFIGPSGCGKSTTLRCLNRMHPQNRTRLEGKILFDNQNLYHPTVDPRMVRIYIGMVFQQPNPFHISVFENVAFGLRLNGYRGDMEERVENALRQAALWDDVKDRLQESGNRALRRTAAAVVHRPGHRRGAASAPDGRALFRARSNFDRQD